MSLRSRLILAFLAVVSLILLLGVVSYLVNREIRTGVASLRASGVLDLRGVDLPNVGLEIEGYWNPGGSFVATDVEIVPRSAHPKLRGAIHGIDPVERSITLYGMPIRVGPDTKSGDAEGGSVRFEDLSPGQRIEVSCDVEDGRWDATKIKLRDVKASDKVKGTATAAELDGQAPETVEIHGLLVLLEPSIQGSPESALGRISKAVQMALAVQEFRAAAHALVRGMRAGARAPDEPGAEPNVRTGPAADRLVQAAEEFDRLVVQSLPGGGDAARSSPSGEQLSLLRPMAKKQALLDGHVETLRGLSRGDPERAGKYVDEVLDPFLEEELVPLVQAYISQSEEELGDRLRSVLARTDTTTRAALAMSALAVAVAVLLGVLVWRSIDRPIRALHAAAVRLGQGDLDTRVELRSRDEIGVLAEAFNRMAAELSTTTVSVRSLESVFDSMAGALILLDAQRRITNVNRAALDLVGYERAELLGREIEAVCRTPAGEPTEPVVPPVDGGAAAVVHRVFVRKDGSEVPVSFSGAEVRSRGGPLQGYVCVAQDLTGQKDIEARVRASLAEKELLLREVHHRVKNNLQVVSSLLAMQSSLAADPEVSRKLEESQDRIRSMALIHEQLYQSAELADIDIRAYLETLTEQIAHSFGRTGDVAVRLRVDDIGMDIDQSMACGLIVNELMTNALKHAFPEGRAGAIEVTLSESPSGDRVLTVSDDGVGIGASGIGGGETLGMSLVRTLAQQLRGRVDVRGGRGTAVSVVFPRELAEARS